MTKLILLPGNSKNNKEWIENVAENLGRLFDSLEIIYYSHWSMNKELIDIELESKKLRNSARPENVVIFAKSVGVLLALKNIYEKTINPERCIFLGTPILWSRKNNLQIDDYLTDYHTETLFIQKEKDPAISFSKLKRLLLDNNVKNCEIVSMAGEDHNYTDISKIKEEIRKFLNNEY